MDFGDAGVRRGEAEMTLTWCFSSRDSPYGWGGNRVKGS
jgi:hypothetical protein